MDKTFEADVTKVRNLVAHALSQLRLCAKQHGCVVVTADGDIKINDDGSGSYLIQLFGAESRSLCATLEGNFTPLVPAVTASVPKKK
jgi:hypothetical protein